MQELYAFINSGNDSIEKAEKELFFSINKAYDLFHYILLLLIDIQKYAESRIELAKDKKIPSFEDLHPNIKFINNKVIEQINQNVSFNNYINKLKMSWVNYPELIKNIYYEILKNETYIKYMQNSEESYSIDKKIILHIYEEIIANNELLYQVLEEQSIYWNDDVEFVISMILKMLEKFKENQDNATDLPEMYKNNEDIEFVKIVFHSCILNHDENVKMIKKFSKNWDIDRIAFMDILLIEMAICEITEMQSIPVRVSFNEYIELAKYYSTEKSSLFVNGILDKIIQFLKSENKIIKKGRGLIGEN
ncbi:MAG: transcription antitermination factor NusB [Bacteroidota bacterium]